MLYLQYFRTPQYIIIIGAPHLLCSGVVHSPSYDQARKEAVSKAQEKQDERVWTQFCMHLETVLHSLRTQLLCPLYCNYNTLSKLQGCNKSPPCYITQSRSLEA